MGEWAVGQDLLLLLSWTSRRLLTGRQGLESGLRCSIRLWWLLCQQLLQGSTPYDTFQVLLLFLLLLRHGRRCELLSGSGGRRREGKGSTASRGGRRSVTRRRGGHFLESTDGRQLEGWLQERVKEE